MPIVVAVVLADPAASAWSPLSTPFSRARPTIARLIISHVSGLIRLMFAPSVDDEGFQPRGKREKVRATRESTRTKARSSYEI